jgi:hypothetical protein
LICGREVDECGDSFVVTLVAVLILLAALLMATNLIVDQYGQGVIRTAVDEGAQVGSVQASLDQAVSACRAKESEVMGGLLAGGFGRRVQLACAVQNGLVVATASGQLPGWLPPVPAVKVSELGTSHFEASPPPIGP